jgi:hypothetical protein
VSHEEARLDQLRAEAEILDQQRAVREIRGELGDPRARVESVDRISGVFRTFGS